MKITTEERVDELVKKTLESKGDTLVKAQRWLILVATVAAMTTGAAAFVHKFFVKPEIERTAQEAARYEADKTKQYCVERYLEMAEDVKDIKDGLERLSTIMMQRRR